MSTETVTVPSLQSPKHHKTHRRRSPARSESELLLSNASSSPAPDPEESNEDKKSSRLAFVLTPILFLSFIVSLILVDNRTRSSIHPPTTPCDNNCDSRDYYHSRQRKIAKLELMDAFEMRDWLLRRLGYGWWWGKEEEKKDEARLD